MSDGKMRTCGGAESYNGGHAAGSWAKASIVSWVLGQRAVFAAVLGCVAGVGSAQACVGGAQEICRAPGLCQISGAHFIICERVSVCLLC